MMVIENNSYVERARSGDASTKSTIRVDTVVRTTIPLHFLLHTIGRGLRTTG